MKLPKLVLALTIALTGCGTESPFRASSQAASHGADGSQPGDSATPEAVNVATVKSARLKTTLSLPAQTAPYEIVDIYPKVTGFLEMIRVDRGSRVRAGELIARLSAPELVAQRTQAEAAVHGAEAQLQAAEAKLASDQATYLHLEDAAKTPGVVAGNDLLVSRQTAEADRAQVEAASNSVQAAKEALRGVGQLESYLEIRAPFDGVVTQRNLHPGALLGPASGQSGAPPMVRIEDTGHLRLVVPVPQAYVAGVRREQQVAFSVPAYPGRIFRAPVARIAESVNQDTRTMAVELDVRNPDPPIIPGTFATVEWPLQRSYPTLFVPAAAITTDLQRTFVIRVSEGRAEWIDVKTGVTVKGETEIFAALHPGDVVVSKATDAIRPGAWVSPQGE